MKELLHQIWCGIQLAWMFFWEFIVKRRKW